MCGRYSLTTPVEGMQRAFAFSETPNLAPRYNIAPTQSAPVVRLAADGARVLALLCWGLVPSWAKDPAIGNRMINARAETLGEKPAFRAAFRARRCLVPADGFYEWRKVGALKQPYRVALADGGPFAFAGLWEHWAPKGADAVESFAIVTTAADELLKPIHDRMPVILDPAAYEPWLRGPVEAAAAALERPLSAALRAFPVSKRVNNPRNDDAGCLAPAEAEEV